MDITNRFHALALAVALGASSLAGCQQHDEASPPKQTSNVLIETVTPERLQMSALLPGRVEPLRIAEIRARVPGIVIKRHFEEGAEVKAGDLLFEIDPAPLKAALAKANGELAKANADVFDAESKLKRYAPLVKINAISSETYDTADATLGRAKAAQQSARADVETARLNLGYASVTAPISGKIGRAMVTEGALVGQGEATLMARVQQLDHVYVDFTQSAAESLALKAALIDGKLVPNPSANLRVRIENTGLTLDGQLLFSDVAVDPSTGQVTLRGRFKNSERLLLPGMYVRVESPQGVDPQAISVPQRAIQRDSNGQAQVWLVSDSGQLNIQPVQTGVMQGARWQIVDGLQEGDRVVVSNLSGLTVGDTPTPQPAENRPPQVATD